MLHSPNQVRMSSYQVSFLLFLFFAYCKDASSTPSICHNEERRALIEFKYAFAISSEASIDCNHIIGGHPAHPKTESWDANKARDCCSWDGVRCDEATGHVIELDLSCSQLDGTLELNSSLFHLVHLQKLNLAFNNFKSSRIPPPFGTLSELTHLNLSSSSFSGVIPYGIQNLTKLVSLDLSMNYKSVIPSEDLGELLKRLSHLQVLSLDLMEFSFTETSLKKNFSSQFFQISLASLSLRICDLSPKFLDYLFQHPKLHGLKFLSLFGANITGTFPDSISNLKRLEYFDLSACYLPGPFPLWVQNLTQLIHLDLQKNYLEGQIPPLIFSNLKSLTHLDLSSNSFQGNIPAVLGNLTKMQTFYLNYNHFSGEFPSWISNLTKLVHISLFSNLLSGPIASNISQLNDLETLDFSENFFNETMPSWLFSLPSLVSLNLQTNRFMGPLPPPPTHGLQSLISLRLSSNAFNGTIPPALFDLPSLEALYIENNKLSGAIPSPINGLRRLIQLGLSNNTLEMFVPCSLFKLPALEELYLGYNKLSGINCAFETIPLNFIDISNNVLIDANFSSIHNLVNLSNLDVSTNNLSVIWGLEMLAKLPILSFLDLSFNMLFGPLAVLPSSITSFRILNNRINGVIPSRICDMTDLQFLDLSSNNLSGSIPECVLNCSSLLVLNLRRNNFSGPIPQIFEDQGSLKLLDLSFNRWEGPLPRSLVNCLELEVLDLGNNLIVDTFPSWLEALPELKILVLRDNRFFGSILEPTNVSAAFTNLNVLDLSHNEFSGQIPSSYFDHSFRSMMIQDLDYSYPAYVGTDYYRVTVTMAYKGYERELSRVLIIFKAIDLSNNRFSGYIPDSIGNLHSLIILNLSNNGLMGHIPKSLENMKDLESLDLSSNNLTGKIPSTLTSLQFLGIFNLSYNDLEGSIPVEGQFETFSNASYIGNSKLCGLPLSKNCLSKQEEPILQPVAPLVKHETLNWKAVVIGYGCGAVVAFFLGHAVIKEEWVMKLFNIKLQGWRKIAKKAKMEQRRC